MLQIYTWQVHVKGLCVYVHILYILHMGRTFQVAQWFKKKKNPPAKQETQVQSLRQEDPLEKEMATHSSIFA